jgi:hypothetical protein
LEDPGIDVRIILRWIFRKWEGAWNGSIWLRIGTGNVLSGSIKFREFLGWLRFV